MPNYPVPDIIYHHNDWIVVCKPAGFTIQELLEAWQNMLLMTLHPAHRLDKDTSGLWLIATNAESNRTLSQLFALRQVNKVYVCLTQGKPRRKQGKIAGDMSKSRRGQWKLERTQQNPAITLFRSIGTNDTDGLRIVFCKLLTGKTHQIRVAMNANGTPIAGDAIYQPGKADKYDRLYLHAWHLGFRYQNHEYRFTMMPNTGERFSDCLIQAASEQLPIDFISPE
ncbi:putative RNA pseudouridine synthase [BD1-7 clade bacterium]|uniref:Putative RNA pseudouridine synthase n=1 Tax=BD1-7 clade bacterium TaxID=2029982 RepID=A0A5S9QRC2_9GAMM|nr:putative RNA pseudouridine synthase [BD1-7 clade bacterium]CAA0120778.1 putative RNA pseudouridine synthase [BD1-7 clade bacterium]